MRPRSTNPGQNRKYGREDRARGRVDSALHLEKMPGNGRRRREAGNHQWSPSLAAAKIRAIGGRAVTGEETPAGRRLCDRRESMGAVKTENDGLAPSSELSEAGRRALAWD